jgi:hypothetical protein
MLVNSLVGRKVHGGSFRRQLASANTAFKSLSSKQLHPLRCEHFSTVFLCCSCLGRFCAMSGADGQVDPWDVMYAHGAYEDGRFGGASDVFVDRLAGRLQVMSAGLRRQCEFWDCGLVKA